MALIHCGSFLFLFFFVFFKMWMVQNVGIFLLAILVVILSVKVYVVINATIVNVLYLS